MAIKILNILTNGLRREGISTTQLVFLNKMDKSSLQIDVAAVHNNDPAVIHDFEAIGCRVVTLPDRKKDTLQYFRRLMQTLRRGKYDIIHVHGSSAMLSIELMAAKMAGVPVRIAHSHNTTSGDAKLDRLLRPLFHRTYTHGLACGIDAGHWLFDGAPFTVVHNGQDFSNFHFSSDLRKQQRKKLLLENKFVVGHVGRLNTQKNHRYLLQVFAAIQAKVPNAVLYLMGDGPLRSQIEELARELGILDTVIFTGNVSDVSLRLQAMDVMVLPSLYEGLPTVVLEWQAVGLPSLISDSITKECAPSDLVSFMSLEEEAQKWAAKAIDIYEKQNNREADAARATLQLKEAGFEINKNAQDLEEMYIEFLRGNQ